MNTGELLKGIFYITPDVENLFKTHHSRQSFGQKVLAVLPYYLVRLNKASGLYLFTYPNINFLKKVYNLGVRILKNLRLIDESKNKRSPERRINMKKILSVTLALTLILGAVCVFPASADIFTNSIVYGDYWYIVLDDDTVAIGADNPSLSGTLVIPETINGYTVTEIATSGFSGTQITDVVIPNTVTRIKDYAFSYNPNLKNVIIPYSVTAIEYCAFANCPELTYMFIPDSVTDIELCAIGYEDDELDDGGYVEVDNFVIEGYKGSAAERYADENGYHYKFIARDAEYKENVLELLNIPEEDPGNGGGWLEYYSEIYRYHSESTPCEATPDYVLVEVFENVSGYSFEAELFGNYILRSSECHYPSTFGYVIYLPETNEIYTLEKAYEYQIEGIEKVFTEGIVGDLLGDVNYDKKLNIKDATLIQKSIASLTEIKNNDISGWDSADPENRPAYIADFNCDGKVNIRDATAIQKAIAGIKNK